MKREKNALHLSLQKIRCLSGASRRRWVPNGGGDGETVVIEEGGILLLIPPFLQLWPTSESLIPQENVQRYLDQGSASFFP